MKQRWMVDKENLTAKRTRFQESITSYFVKFVLTHISNENYAVFQDQTFPYRYNQISVIFKSNFYLLQFYNCEEGHE